MRKTIKEAREDAGLTQVETALAIKVSEPTFRKYERHPETMPIKKAVCLAAVLGVDFMSLKLYEDADKAAS